MSVTVQQHSPTRFSLEASIPAVEVSAAFATVVAKIAPKVKIPGFRPGKAPKNVLLQKYGREIHQDVAEQLLSKHFWARAQEAGVVPISSPALEKLDLKEGLDATFRAQFDVAPQVDLPEFKGLTLAKQKRIIDADAVAEHLEGLRQRAARLMPVEGGAEAGMLLTFDIRVLPPSEKGKAAKATKYTDQTIELKPERPLDKELLGIKAGETRTFTISHDENDPNPGIRGLAIGYEVSAAEVRERQVPALDDDMAKDLGAFQTLDELKAAVTKDLEEAAERDALGRLQTLVLDTLLDAAKFEAPRSMVGLQLDDYCQEFAQHAARNGVDPKRINWAAYRQHRLRDAERAVRSGYLLQAIGNAEDIQVTDEEIDADIRTFMQENQVQAPFETFKENLEKRGATTEIKGRIRTDKIFERLLASAAITEELMEKAAFEALVELERKRDSGEAIERFDAGGLEGGDLHEQEGGAPAHHHHGEEAHVHGPDCDHGHDEVPATEAKPKKRAAKKKTEE